MESVSSSCKGQWIFPQIAFFQCFTSSFCCSVTSALRSNFSILSPFLPVWMFQPLMPVVLVLLSLWAVKKDRRDWKDMGTTKAAEWAAAGLGAQCVEWHLHFKRGRLNEPRHFFFFFFFFFKYPTRSSLLFHHILCHHLLLSLHPSVILCYYR